METENKLNAIIELLNSITLDINSVEVILMESDEYYELARRCQKLWLDAYNIKREFILDANRTL